MKQIGIFLLAVVCISLCAQAQAPTEQQRLQRYAADLQGNPSDNALRAKIITLAQEMKPAPPIPEAAREHYVMATTFVGSAKDATGYERAIGEFKAALLAAPWWAEAYKNLAIVQKTAVRYDDAIANLQLYLLSQPVDARDAQDEIYKLKALKQAAKDDQIAQAEREREEQQRAYEAAFAALLRQIEGSRYSAPSDADWGRQALLIRDGYLIRGITDGRGLGSRDPRSWRFEEHSDKNLPGNSVHQKITAYEVHNTSNCTILWDYMEYETFVISEDGSTITRRSRMRFTNGAEKERPDHRVLSGALTSLKCNATADNHTDS